MSIPPRYIVVEGVIGVGKTTLVRALAEALNARTVYEVFEENPFLEGFYRDRARYALSTEMFFLLSRFNQQELFAQEDLLQQFSVSDYLFEKCRLFAELTLNEAEASLFRRTYEILARQIPTPDLVVHLHAPIDTLLERIAARGRAYEQDMDPEYLAELDRRYRALFLRYADAPVLSIDTSNIDFREPEAVARLVERILKGDLGAAEPATFRLEG
jgi:deoxyadenosine/deoxycytidine kinase